MKREEFTKCCQAAEEGNEIYLENLGSHESGRLIYCSGDRFQVRVGEQRKEWSPAMCEETGSSSEPPA